MPSFFAGSGTAPLPSGGRPASYADVAAFEAGLHVRDAHSGSPCSRETSPISVSSPKRVLLKPDTVNEIFGKVDDLSSSAAIFRFRGFWPSLAKLHAWIAKTWVPLLEHDVHIFPMARGFFMVKFDSVDDRNTILCNYGFSWEDKAPLMAKPWHPDFDPLTESFNKVPVWVRIPNLPLHLWLDSVFEAIGETLGDFLYVDPVTSDFLHSTYARLLVEMDLSKGLPEQVCLDSPRGSWTLSLDYEGVPFRCRKCRKTGHIAARCAAGKPSSKRPPSWWSGVSPEHYSVAISRDGPLASDAGSSDDASDYAPSGEEVFPPGPSVSLPGPVGGQVPGLSPVPSQSDLSPGPEGGQLASKVLTVVSDSPGPIVSGDWSAEAAMVEEGWTSVKRKKTKPSAPPLDMNLRSSKGGSKSKAKS